MIRNWMHCTTAELSAMDKSDALVIVPIGAVEQHGGHLPVGTDSIILDHLLSRLAEEAEFPGHTVLIAPLVPMGKSNEHADFAGTISFSTKTVMAMLTELCGSIRRHGFDRFILVNSHGGNTDLLNVLARDLRIGLDAEFFVFDWWFTTFWNDILAELQESSGDYGVFHACELETSLMLAIRPDLVDMAKAKDEYPEPHLTCGHVTIKGPITIGWKTQDLSAGGVVGAPSFASAEKGGRFIAYAVGKLEDMLTEVLNTRYRKV